MYSHSCGYDFDQTITGPSFAIVGDSVRYTSSENQSGNTYKWEVYYAGRRGWYAIPNGRSSTVRFNIGNEATPSGINQMSVRCTVIKPNNDVSRKTFRTTVEGRPTGGGLPL